MGRQQPKRGSRGRRGRNDRGGRHKGKAPAPVARKKLESKKPKEKPEEQPVKAYNDRFDETGGAGTYPISVPFEPPGWYDQNENLGKFLEQADSDSLVFFQLPSVLPVAEEGKNVPTPVKDLPGGYLGKLVVYRSGKVKLKIGDILFDVDIGTS